MPSTGSAFRTNSTTTIPKATYVPLQLSDNEKSVAARSGGAVRKFGYIRSLNLQPGEVDAARAELARSAAGNQTSSPLLALAKSFEGSPLPSALPGRSQFSNLPDTDFVAFGNALATVRQHAVDAARANAGQPVNLGESLVASNQLATAINQLNIVNNAQNAFKNATPPIGMLNLERIEMTPAGIEQGGLIATIPLAPKERTMVVQQEWSVISQDFTSIVTDSLENYSETGVTDATQLSQATDSQVAHANQFNVNASASGSCGFVTASVATSFGAQDQNSTSAKDSRQHSVQTTKKASSRSIQSHKTTISTSTTTGSSTGTTRMLENPSATDAMRIDYFSMMRKWYCALYRYGLRLTYDITVPEPGAAMREIYAQLDQLQKQAGGQFVFPISHGDINSQNYLYLADQHYVDVPPPPSPSALVQVTVPVTSPGTNESPVAFPVPPGYWVTSIVLWGGQGKDNFPTDPFFVVGAADNLTESNNHGIDLCANRSFLWQQSGTLSLTAVFKSTSHADWGNLYFTVNCAPTDTAMAQWQSTVWTTIYNAAQNQFYANQQKISAQIAALQSKVSNVDTLTLRREENDEIMKCALRWLLGPDFEFMPLDVVALFKKTAVSPQIGLSEQYGIDFTGNLSGLGSQEEPVARSRNDWTIATQYEDRVNFINQAIDWDNIIYFVYSYFWDDPLSWDFIRQIQHPDATRQAFLRAGAARIVLTVRPGWELAWSYFVEFGETKPPPNAPHPYLTIAQQIQDYDSTNYPGIPPANPHGGGPVDDGTPQIGTTSGDVLSPSTTPVTIKVADSTGFVAGAAVFIDTYPSGAQESQTITDVPDGTHIKVQALSKAHDPAQNQNDPYPVIQAGSAGVLIAEWFEYTPTSGVDIVVTSNLAKIA